MEIRRSSWLLLLLGTSLLAASLHEVCGDADGEGPSESECRPYIEKALKELEGGEVEEQQTAAEDSIEDVPTIEIATDDSDQVVRESEAEDEGGKASTESAEGEEAPIESESEQSEAINEESAEKVTASTEEVSTDTADDTQVSREKRSAEEADASVETVEIDAASEEAAKSEDTAKSEGDGKSVEAPQSVEAAEKEKSEETGDAASSEAVESVETQDPKSVEDKSIEATESVEQATVSAESKEVKPEESVEEVSQSVEEAARSAEEATKSAEETAKSAEDEASEGIDADGQVSKEADSEVAESKEQNQESKETQAPVAEESKEDGTGEEESAEKSAAAAATKDTAEGSEEGDSKASAEVTEGEESKEEAPVNELTQEFSGEVELRPRDHIEHLLKLDEDSSELDRVINGLSEITLRDLKKLYENAIKPLETLYKYRDLSNRHFGDAEIFSKPLILFMGPWSGGKSSIINYLLDNEFSDTSLHTGAEPSPAYFNILVHGEKPEILDGTQLAADYTFSGLQKFGQGLEERLRGYRLPRKLLEKVNIVEIPGILEVRKQVSRVFPFNDACQWFIDRADIIFLVYDPSKLDVGPETEAILDQLKGRESQTRIVLNKADQVKPEELMRVQGALIWNISPLMSSPQPPVMYTTSLWSRPYESWAPVRLLQAQERAFLRDLRSAISKRIDNKISSARRFAVRVRNHAKMVDCYLTTYYNHKSVFGNRKHVSDEIIDHPQDYHIYEGLSTLTNISRYDLPDPDVYRDFFRLNPLYDFQQLSATCTYFRGCPINRLDIAIAYDLPELVGKHKRLVEQAVAQMALSTPGS